MRAAYGAFSEFLTREMAIVVLLFVVLYKFCDAFAGTMTAPFVIDLGFSRNDYAAIVKGVGPRRDADRRLCRRHGGARAADDDLPVARRPAAGRVEPGVRLARLRRHQPLGADRRDHRGEFHRRDRHRDLRRLPLVAVPEPAAHRDAVRAADRAVGGRPHVSLVGRGLHRAIDRLAGVLRHQRAGGAAELRAAGLAAGARAFRRVRASRRSWRRTTRTPCAAGSPPTACLRRDNRVRRRPARHARAASPSRSRRAAGP